MTIEASEACAPTTSHAIDESVAVTLAATLKSLAEPLRLRMLSAIASDPRGESCVCDLADLAAVSQPTVSHHLKVLREAGIVSSQRRGTWVWYRITPELRPAVTTLLDSLAPAVVHPAPRAEYAGLADVDHALSQLAETLAARFSTLSAELVTAVVRESYSSLARSARISTHLVPLTRRFATQRLTDITRDRDGGTPQVLFVCVANAGRSQLAAALLTQRAGGRVVARSAGSAPAADIHPSVRPFLAQITQDVDEGQPFPKPLTDDAVRAADVVITMGCGDVCPIIPGVRYEDWPVGDPALASAEGVAAIRDEIDSRVTALLDTLLTTDRTRNHE